MGGMILNEKLEGYYTDLFSEHILNFYSLSFSKESKWQLLSEPIKREKFESMDYIQRAFHIIGFKTISPDISEIHENGSIVIIYDESITNITIESWFIDSNLQKIEQIECTYGNGKVEVKYNLNNEKAAYLYISVKSIKTNNTIPLVYYIINKSSK